MSIKYTEQSRIFRDFRAIPYSDYFYLIRFYEQYNKDINRLPFDEALIMSYYYANALFETQEYSNHIEVAKHILEQSILHNVRYIDGEDIYILMLYKRTIAHLELGDQAIAQNLATQLVRLAPDHYLYQLLLRQCFIRVRPTWIRSILTLSIAASLLGAISTIVLMSLQSYLPAQALIMPYSFLLLAFVGLSTVGLAYYKYIAAPTRQIIAKAKLDKKEQNS